MEILAYQIGIIIIIIISGKIFGKSIRDKVIIGISIFTFFMIFKTWLILLQFISIFIGYSISEDLLNNIKSNDLQSKYNSDSSNNTNNMNKTPTNWGKVLLTLFILGCSIYFASTVWLNKNNLKTSNSSSDTLSTINNVSINETEYEYNSNYDDIYDESNQNKFNNFLNEFYTRNITSLKKLSKDEIYDYLLLNDWIYITTESKSIGVKWMPHDTQKIIFENKFNDLKLNYYERIDYQKFSDDKKIVKQTKSIEFITENYEVFENILDDLIYNNFENTGEEQSYPNLDIASSTPQELEEMLRKDYVAFENKSKKFANFRDTIEINIQILKKIDYNENVLNLKKYKLSLNLD